MYAVALMRDEASPLDDEVAADHDIYGGMRGHYDVPPAVVDLFEWHAMLDRNNDHGFFALQVFRHVPVVDDERARRLIGALRQIIDLHDAFRWGVRQHYACHRPDDRVKLVDAVVDLWKRPGNSLAEPDRIATDSASVSAAVANGV